MIPLRFCGSINDVAQHLGVAKGTVSRALNNYGDVSAVMRQRVAAAAHELGTPLATIKLVSAEMVDDLD
ncbi:MAG: LacI family DNA-binding transcriptional regulator, partial [Prolixibacteraceae bacterium]